MKKQELKLLLKLYNLLQSWFEKCSTNWLEKTLAFKKMYTVLKLHQQALRVVIGDVPEKTVEEKVKQATFYCGSGLYYHIVDVNCAERWFSISHTCNGYEKEIVQFDEIPANAYFLGTVRL